MRLEQLRTIFPGADAKRWHQHANGGGWVQDTASVEASVYLHMDAIVFGNAQVSGDARVYGDAQVSGDARVYGDAQEVSPLHIVGTNHTLTVFANGLLKIGGMVHTIAWWRKHYRASGRAEHYSAAQIKEYAAYIELAAKWMRIHGHSKVNKKALAEAGGEK